MKNNKVASQRLDLVQLLWHRQMHYIIENIMLFLDETSLKNCRQVSTTWNSIIKDENIWKNLYRRISKKEPILETLLERKLNRSKNNKLPEAEKISFLSLFQDKAKLQHNWINGKFTTKLLDLGKVTISMLRMDAKRIVCRSWNNPNPHSIVVWNRWTMETECVLAVPSHISWIRDLQLYGDYIFSLHDLGKILVWDISSQCVIIQFQRIENVPGSYWVQTLVAHKCVVSCFRVFNAQTNSFPETFISIHEISDFPLQLTLKKTEHIRKCTFRGIQSDNTHFVLFLFCFTTEKFKIQLRSIANFSMIHELFIPLDLNVRYSYHSRRLITLSIEDNLEVIKLWEFENVAGEHNMMCITTFQAPSQVSEIGLNSRHLIIRLSNNYMIIWNVSQIFDNCKVIQTTLNCGTLNMPKEAFLLHNVGENCLAFLFDEMLVITYSVKFLGRPPVGGANCSILTLRHFL